MKLGVLAHTFGKRPTADLAQIIADNGFNRATGSCQSVVGYGFSEWKIESWIR